MKRSEINTIMREADAFITDPAPMPPPLTMTSFSSDATPRLLRASSFEGKEAYLGAMGMPASTTGAMQSSRCCLTAMGLATKEARKTLLR